MVELAILFSLVIVLVLVIFAGHVVVVIVEGIEEWSKTVGKEKKTDTLRLPPDGLKELLATTFQDKVGNDAFTRALLYCSSPPRCSCGNADKSRTHIVGECELYKEEWDVVEMRKIDECDVEKVGTLDNGEKTIDVLSDRWWPQTARQEGDKINKTFSYLVQWVPRFMSDP